MLQCVGEPAFLPWIAAGTSGCLRGHGLRECGGWQRRPRVRPSWTPGTSPRNCPPSQGPALSQSSLVLPSSGSLARRGCAVEHGRPGPATGSWSHPGHSSTGGGTFFPALQPSRISQIWWVPADTLPATPAPCSLLSGALLEHSSGLPSAVPLTSSPVLCGCGPSSTCLGSGARAAASNLPCPTG